jgi:hypothetical protein
MPGVTATQSLRYGYVTDPVSYTMQRDLADDIAAQLDAADVLRTAAMKKPVVFASRNTALTLPNLTLTTVPFTSSQYNTHGMVDIATQPTRITVTAAAGAGQYLVETHIQWTYAGWTRGDITILRNGVFYAQKTWVSPQDQDVLQFTTMVDMPNIGDYLSMQVYHEGGGTSGDWFHMRVSKN